MFRVPVLQQQIKRFTQAMDQTDEEDFVTWLIGIVSCLSNTLGIAKWQLTDPKVSASAESVTNSDGEDVDGDGNLTVATWQLNHAKPSNPRIGCISINIKIDQNRYIIHIASFQYSTQPCVFANVLVL